MHTHSNETLAGHLAEVLSDAVVMSHVANGYHWNVKGKDFSQFHKFFGKIYEDIQGSIDPIAENILKIGYDAPFSLQDFMQRTSCKQEPVRSGDPIRMVSSLMQMNEQILSCLNSAFKAADACNEQGIADFLAGRIDMHKKWHWQLTATTGNNVAKSGGTNVIYVEAQPTMDTDLGTDDLAFLGDYGDDGAGFFASGRSRELVLPQNVEAELRAMVDDHNATAGEGLKTTFAKCKTVYRRGARKYAGEMAEGTTRHQSALKRVGEFLNQISSQKLLKTFNTQDADLLPASHVKALSTDPLTASAAVKSGLTVTVKRPTEYKNIDDAILDIVEFSGKGYEAASEIKDAWFYGQSKGKSGYNTALAVALGYFQH
jgi:starvation-inducible DNA-binding protein